MNTSSPKGQVVPKRKAQPQDSHSSPKGTVKEDPTTPTTNRSGKANEPTSAGGKSSDESTEFEDVNFHDEIDDPDFKFVHHKDAQHSSYNSHADHKWKYKEQTAEEVLEEVKAAEEQAEESFEQVMKDQKGTSSRNGAADRPEKYE